MSLQVLCHMFYIFTIEIILGGIMLTKDKLKFRFKPYISIPGGLLIAFGSASLVVFGLYFIKDIEWNIFVNVIVYTIPFIGVILGFYFAYNRSFMKILLTMCVAYTFQSMTHHMGIIVMNTGLEAKIYNSLGEDWYRSYYQLFSTILNYLIKISVYVGCYFLIAKTYVKYYKSIIKTWSVVIMGITVYFTVNIVNVFIMQRLWWADGPTKGVLSGTMIITCILFDALIVNGHKIVEQQKESMIIKATLASRIRQQEMVESSINFINMKCHDLRKELRRLKSKKDTLTDEDFLLLEESLNFYDSSVKTGNVNIDAIIQDKLIYCNSMGIEMTSLVDGNAFSELDLSDAIFLLTNIIDNAIEAVEGVEEKEKKVISLTASKKQGVLFIEQTNYYKGNIVVREDNTIKTSKENKKYHGYGTKSIAYIVKKYEGKINIETANNVFKITIVI